MMKKRILIIGALIIAAGAAAFFFLSQGNGVQVTGAAVVRGDIEEYVEETGTVMARDNLQVYSPAAGRVTEVLVEVGNTVGVGEVLARLDSEALSYQLAQLDAQRSGVVAQLNEARKAGDSNSIRSVQLDIQQLSGTIQDMETDLEDTRTLHEAGAISKEQLDLAVRNLQTQKTNLEKLKLQLNQLSSPASQNLIAQYEAQIRQIDLQKEELASSGEDFSITAGTSGKVLSKSVQKGSYLQPGMSLMELGNTDDLYIQSDILVSEVSDIREGLSVRLINEDLEIEAGGKVSKIYPNAFSRISDLGVEQKRITVEIEMDQIPNYLRPGYDLQVRIITESSENTLIIPENAVFTMDSKDYVFVVADGSAEIREIQEGIGSGSDIEVLTGLQEGEVVIQSPESELEEGARIEVSIQ